MGKASRTKVDSSRREKIAAQRAAARRAEKRRRILIASGSIIAVLAIVLAFVLIKMNTGSPKPAAASSVSNGPTGAALAAVVGKVTTVPASTLDAVGRQRRGSRQDPDDHRVADGPDRQRQARDAVHGRRVLSLLRGRALGDDRGAEPVRHVLRPDHHPLRRSTGAEPDPNTPTWTLSTSTYTSKYLTFTAGRAADQHPRLQQPLGTYINLQTPTAAQQALVNKYDVAPYTTQNGSIPFVDFGNKYVSIGTTTTRGCWPGSAGPRSRRT